MIKYIKIPILIISLLTASLSFGQNSYSYRFTTDPNDLEISTSLIEGHQFQTIKLTEPFYLNELGKPKLPQKKITVLVPMNMEIGDIVLSVTNEQDCNITYPIEPVQEDMPTSIEPFTPVFQYDSLVYASNLYPTSNIETDLQYYGGVYGILSISYCPFNYNPNLGTLNLITEANLNISFKTIKGTNKLPLNPSETYHDLITKSLQSTVINPEFLSSYTLNLTEASQTLNNGLEVYEYVIVTTNALKNSFSDFINWKMSKGIHTGVVTIEDILSEYSGDNIFSGDEILDDAGALRQYLYEAYQEGLTWVLLAGDQPNIPIRYGNRSNNYTTAHDQIPADIYFADFNGNWNVDGDIYYGEISDDDPDYHAEVFLGRLIASSTQHIANWTSKIIKYELNPGNGNYTYLDNAFMFQADQMQQGTQAETVASHFTTFNTNIFNELPSYNSPSPTFPKGADIVNELNTNMYGLVGWFCHGGTGHGSSGCAPIMSGVGNSPYWKIEAEDALSDPNSEQETGNGLDNLSSIDFPNITYSISCDVTPFDMTSALGNLGGSNSGEAFTVNTTGGGIAFLGNTRSGWVSTSYLLFNLFGDVVSDGCNGITNLGVIENLSKIHYGTSVHYLGYSHNLVGCPETKMWTEVPQTFNVTVTPDNTFINQENEYTVNIDGLSSNQEVLVTIYKEGEVFERENVVADINGDAQVIFENIVCQTAGDFSVVATSCNYIPNISQILIKECDLTEPNLEITTDETWTSDTELHSNIIVKTGNTLTIESNLFMPEGAKILVEPNAQLVVNGGTITSACGTMWEGIVVTGDKNAPQSTQYQGKVIIKSNALIENAEWAITNIYGHGGGVYYPSGAIIQVSNSTFKNNTMDIQLDSYQNVNSSGIEYNNLSYIRNCTFETTDNYLGTYINSSVSLKDVNGVKILGSTFVDNRTSINVIQDGRTGIYSWDANFSINEICGLQQWPPPATCNGDQTTFNNLKYGIRSFGYGSSADFNISIKNSDFDCAYGVYLMDIENAEIHLNDFTEREDLHDGSSAPALYGLYLDYCTNYDVEGNNFTGVATGLPAHLVGVVVKNQHDENTSIYRNYFDGLGAGTEAIGQNKSSNPSYPNDGLTILCNDYENGLNNIFVTDDTDNSVPATYRGIALNQGINGGNTDELAGNLFGDNSSKHLNNSNCATFNYYHHNPALESRVEPDPNKVQGNINVVEVWGTSYDSGSCPDNLDDGGGIVIGFKSLANEELVIIEDTKAELETLVDGGNTTELKNDVIFANDQDAYDKYNDLMSKEGYLSEEVLEEVAGKENALNKAMVRDVLVANKHAAKSAKVQAKLEQRLDKLPDYMRAQIQEGLTELSAKEYLELRKGKAKVRHDYLINKGVRDLLKDSLDKTSEILEMLSNTGDIAFEYRKLAILDAKNRTAEAEQVLAEMQTIEKSEKQQENLQDFTDVRNLLNTWKQESKNMNALSEADINTLKTYSSKNNKAAAKAMIVLQANGQLDYVEPVYLPEDTDNRSAQKTWSSFGTPTIEKDMLKLYPNPAKDYFTVEYAFTSNDKPIVFKVTDVQGKLIYTKILQYKHDQLVIDASNYRKGTYYISLFAGSKLIKSKSIQINK